MKNVNITTHHVKAVHNLCDHLEAIYDRIESGHYQGSFVTWRVVTTMHLGLTRKYIDTVTDGELTLTLATDCIAHLSAAEAVTHFTLDLYGEDWPYRDALQVLHDNIDHCKASIAVVIDKIQ